MKKGYVNPNKKTLLERLRLDIRHNGALICMLLIPLAVIIIFPLFAHVGHPGGLPGLPPRTGHHRQQMGRA